MNKHNLFWIFLILFLEAQSQCDARTVKKRLDTTAIFSWPSLGQYRADDVEISANGRFFSYLRTKVLGQTNRVLQSVQKKKILYTYPAGSNEFFSRDSKRMIYLSGDEIVDFNIETGKERRIKGVLSMSYPKARKGELLAYEKKEGRALLIEYLLEPGKTLTIDSVCHSYFNNKGDGIAVVFEKGGKQVLRWLDLHGDRKVDVELSFGEKMESLTFDNSGKQIVFVSNSNKRNIFLFNLKTGKVQTIIDSRETKFGDGEYISRNCPFFSLDDRHIFFTTEKPFAEKKNVDYVKIDIWNYRDPKLNNSCRLGQPVTYTYSVSTNRKDLIRLEDDSLHIVGNNGVLGDYVIVERPTDDRFWMRNRYFGVVSLKDGSRSHLSLGVGFMNYYYSPKGEYLVFCDSLENRWDYYSYSTKDAKVRNLTKSIPASNLDYIATNGKRLPGDNYLNEIVGWLVGEDAFLMYDSFDILKVFLAGTRDAINLTNGYGRRNNTRLALTYGGERNNYYKSEDTLLLTAFNWDTKYNGFYSKILNKDGDPDSISMKPWIICGYGGYNRILPVNNYMVDIGMLPLKAADTSLWLVKCNSPSSAPNYYLTNDLKNFEKLTDIEPQREYEWYTSELVHWRQFDSTIGSAVLYKPENFDPQKKYPVIIFHYRELSQNLYYYHQPRLPYSTIDIPWFVSRGYLVLTPDVYLWGGGSGPAAFNSVASAAEWLSTLPFVDKRRIGLNGHSQAGFQTNYIIAHTGIFAAALSGAGGADAILSSFIESGCGIERFRLNESRLGKIWDYPEIYKENSPFWLANKITTPILLFHCKKDEAVPWVLGLQFFLALWRLEKPVWMLQYDDGGHALRTRKDALDYSERIDQFFDHYLKGSLPPIWMTKGVSPNKKGIESGLELDSSYSVL